MKKVIKRIILVSMILNTLIFAQWSQTNGPMTGNILQVMADGGKAYALSVKDIVYVSEDSCKTWSMIKSISDSTYIVSLALFKGRIFGGGAMGVYTLDENGFWKKMGDAALPFNYFRSILVNDSGIIAGTESGLYHSADSGNSWTSVNNGILLNSYVWSLYQFGNEVFACTDTGLFKTENNGVEWQEITSGQADQRVTCFTMIGTKKLIGTLDGVYASDGNSDSWYPSKNGMTIPYILSLINNNGTLYAGTYDGFFASTDSGKNWVSKSSGLDYRYIYSMASFGKTVLAGTIFGGVYRSDDDGAFSGRIRHPILI